MHLQHFFRRLTAGLVAGGALVTAAWADDHGPRTPLLPKYEQECGGCHLAFPPAMLPAPSWQRLMDGLPRHFGTDASLDAATTRELSAWLAANAANAQNGRKQRRDAAPPPEDRITRSNWFLHEHDEIAPAVWQRPAVGRVSNCAACHTGAVQGRFSEHDVRIPR
jgi:hypothetical protein